MTRLVAGCLALLLSAGCASPAPEPRPSPSPAPSSTQDQTDLVGALRRTFAVPHRFTIDADLPENERLTGTGAVDSAGKVYASSTKALERIVVGTDYYQREPGDSWVHLDLRRVKNDSPLHLDTADPTGLGQFADAITNARRTAPGTYSGRFRPDNEGEPFLPLGAPSLWSIGLRVSPFTATLDAHGWVTSITIELSPTDSPTLTMKATLSAHGKPVNIEAPEALEADDTVYE